MICKSYFENFLYNFPDKCEIFVKTGQVAFNYINYIYNYIQLSYLFYDIISLFDDIGIRHESDDSKNVSIFIVNFNKLLV